jgi:hypothetical protein
MKTRLFATLSGIAVCVGVLIFVGAKGEPNVFAQNAPTPGNLYMCEGATGIPGGWVIVNEVGNEQCRYSGPGTPTTGRLLTLRVPKYMPPNPTICADAGVPAGYVVTGFASSSGKCLLITSDPNATPGDAMVKTLQQVPAAANAKTADIAPK